MPLLHSRENDPIPMSDSPRPVETIQDPPSPRTNLEDFTATLSLMSPTPYICSTTRHHLSRPSPVIRIPYHADTRLNPPGNEAVGAHRQRGKADISQPRTARRAGAAAAWTTVRNRCRCIRRKTAQALTTGLASPGIGWVNPDPRSRHRTFITQTQPERLRTRHTWRTREREKPDDRPPGRPIELVHLTTYRDNDSI